MYLLDTALLITHLLPPHWRGTWREVLLRALLAPLDMLYRSFIAWKEGVQPLINSNMQVAVLRHKLSHIADIAQHELSITEEPNTALALVIGYPRQRVSAAEQQAMSDWIQQYKIAGVTFTLQPYG